MPKSEMTYSPAAFLHRSILATTSKAHKTTRAITLLASQIPQLSPLQARQSRSVVRMNRAYTEVRAGRLQLPDAEGVISSVTKDIDEIAEEVDDYIIFWSEGGDMVVDGVVLGRSFVRHGGERGVLEKQRKRALVNGIIERARDEGWSQIRKEGLAVGRWRDDGGAREEGR